MTRRLLTLALLFLAIPAGADFNAKVVGVSDGDTLTVIDANRRELKIRLHGIDAPEKGQPWSDVAKRRLSELLFGQLVRVNDREQDRYGRTIAVVIIPGPNATASDVNRQLVREGLAWSFIRYSKDYSGDEMAARRERLNLWRDPQPVAPWEWRKVKRAKR